MYTVELIVLLMAALMVNWIGLGRAMSRLSVSTYVEFHQATNHTFNPYMPIVVVGASLSPRVEMLCACAKGK